MREREREKSSLCNSAEVLKLYTRSILVGKFIVPQLYRFIKYSSTRLIGWLICKQLLLANSHCSHLKEFQWLYQGYSFERVRLKRLISWAGCYTSAVFIDASIPISDPFQKFVYSVYSGKYLIEDHSRKRKRLIKLRPNCNLFYAI